MTLLALAGVAAAADVTWTNAAGDGNWGNTANWSTGTVPQKDDKIIISNGDDVVSTGYDYASGTGNKILDGSTTFVVTNGSTLVLGKPSQWKNDRYDAAYEIGAGSSVSVAVTYLRGDSSIQGTLYVYNDFSPGVSSSAIDFGQAGVIQFMSGSKNAMSGNNRTLTLSGVLDSGVNGAGATYTLETRYLIAGVAGGAFDASDYQKLTLSGGTFTGTGGLEMTSALTGNLAIGANDSYTTATLSATAADYGKYLLGWDASGVYVQYVKAAGVVPEPTTATLSLLALAGLAARRRRK